MQHDNHTNTQKSDGALQPHLAPKHPAPADKMSKANLDSNHLHHQQAASHLDQAAEHHRNAARECATGNHKDAAYHAHLAEGHILHAEQHSADACKHNVEHSGVKK